MKQERHILLDYIAEGEHLSQDFKFCITDSKKIAKSLVAFANTKGGRLLLGVKDNGKIAGVKSEEEFYMIEGAATLYCKPEVPFTSINHKINGKEVVEIFIEESKNKPHLAKNDEGKWLAYIRKEDQNLLANKIMLEVWRKQKNNADIYLEFSETEKTLLDFLMKHNKITFSKFKKIASINHFKAEKTLIKLILMKILKIEFTEKDTFYSYDENFDKDSLSLSD